MTKTPTLCRRGNCLRWATSVLHHEGTSTPICGACASEIAAGGQTWDASYATRQADFDSIFVGDFDAVEKELTRLAAERGKALRIDGFTDQIDAYLQDPSGRWRRWLVLMAA